MLTSNLATAVLSSHKKGRDRKGRFASGNQLAAGKGRPAKYQNAQQLAARADEYFATLNGRPPTTAGLAVYLGFADRSSLAHYKRKPEFSSTIKRALLIIECHYEQRLFEPNCRGAIFALKNFGWKG